jgi:glycosyltransferase involved in cell wall biosynthesis
LAPGGAGPLAEKTGFYELIQVQERKKILVLIDWFLPGIKAGGPVKSVSSMIKALHKDFDFYILTSDRDFGDTTPYPDITADTWIPYSEHVQICYLSKQARPVGYISEALNTLQPDVVYINSFFSKNYSILPLRLIRNKKLKTKTILAPRGMLSEGALRIKPLKKKLFIAYSKITRLHKNIVWHSTKADETAAIKKMYGSKAHIYEAQNISDVELRPPAEKQKIKGELKLVYLGRIAENKNLLLALKAMKTLSPARITFDIYGSLEDEHYWKTCQQAISELPSTIQVQYKGLLDTALVSATIRQYHFLVLLSYSENFGHAIVEALSNGVPVIISNTTPWQNLQGHHAGWDVSIESEGEVNYALRMAIALDQQEYNKYAEAAYRFAAAYCVNQKVIDQLNGLFQ